MLNKTIMLIIFKKINLDNSNKRRKNMNTENKTTKKKQYAFRPYSERNVDLKKNAKNLKNWLERNPEYKVKQSKVTVPKSFLNSFFKEDNYKYLEYNDILECLKIIELKIEDPNISFSKPTNRRNYSHINDEKFSNKRSLFNNGKNFLKNEATEEDLENFNLKFLKLKDYFIEKGYDEIGKFVIELDKDKFPFIIVTDKEVEEIG
jgi:hypothetical protein